MPCPNAVLAARGISEPSINEFLAHPDLRQVATFFLGWVFLASLAGIAISPVIKPLARQCSESMSQLAVGVKGPSDVQRSQEKSDLTSIPRMQHSSLFTNRSDGHVFVLILSICFAFSSIAHFSSLLTYSASGGAVACAFLVAWGGISSQFARAIGALIMTFELREWGVKSWESFCAWGSLIIGLSLAFATLAISVGKVQLVPELGVYLCYQRYFVPTSLVASIVFLLLEVYILVRLVSFIAPRFLEFRHRIGAVQDTRVLRALSLLLFELLTLVPRIKFISIVGEFVPFSIGALAILITFNKRSAPIRLDGVTNVPSMSVLSSSLHGSLRPTSTVGSSMYRRRSTQENSRFGVEYIPNHPFAAPAVAVAASRNERVFPVFSPATAHSSLFSVDSATANSIQTAVINVASRSKRSEYPFQYLEPSPPPVPSGRLRSGSVTSSRDEGTRSPLRISVHIPHPNSVIRQQFEAEHSFFSPDSSGMLSPETQQIPLITATNHSSQATSRSSSRSRKSALYGSDIIRGSTDKVDLTKEPHNTNLTRAKSFLSSPVDSILSNPWSMKRQSGTTTVTRAPSTEDAHVGYSENYTPKRQKLRTFGEQSFRSLGFGSPPATPRRSKFNLRKSRTELSDKDRRALATLPVAVEPVPDLGRPGTRRIRGPRPLHKVFSPGDISSINVRKLPGLPEVKTSIDDSRSSHEMENPVQSEA